MKLTYPVIAAAVLGSISVPAHAQWSVVVPEANITALTAVDAAPEDIAVDGSGNIIVVDESPSLNEFVLRFNSTGGSGVKITDEAAIIAAIEAVNGTSTQATFTINSVAVAADGDLVLTNGDAGSPDSVVTVTPAGVVTVISTSVNGATSPVEGINTAAVIGNTVYLGVNGAFGATEDAILSLDTNAAGPAAAPTVVASQAAMEAVVTGGVVGGIVLGPMAPGGTGLYVADSGGGTSTDDIFQVALPGGAVSMLVDDTTVEGALATTDVGYTGMTVDQQGTLYLTNLFGAADTTDDGVIKITNPGQGSQAISIYLETAIATDISGGTLSPARMAFNPSTNQVLFANQTGTAEGVIGHSTASAVEAWTLY